MWPLKLILDWIPLFQHLKSYDLRKLGRDCRAGLNVALLDFPQGMAYAMIAGLPVQFGIFSSAIGSITGPVFAGSRFLMLGPTNASAVLLLSGFLALGLPDDQKLAALPMLLVMISAILFLGALLRIELVIQYVSRCVITGYITAAALLIIVNQLKYILGVQVPRSGTFFGTMVLTTQHLHEIDWRELICATTTLLIYYGLVRFKKIPTVALTLVVISTLNFALEKFYGVSAQTLEAIPSASWSLTWPVFSMDLLSQLMGVAFALAFLSLLESSSIAKSLAAQSGDQVNIRQQMISMGVSNACNAIGNGMPVSGSLTRSMLNWKSGAVTPVSSIVSGSLLVVGFFVLGHSISAIPKSALASLVMIVGLSLIKMDNIRIFLTVTRTDGATFLVTFLGGLFLPLDKAIYLGVGLSLLFFLKKVARPKMVELAFNPSGELSETIEDKHEAISIVHVEGDLFFGSADAFLDQVRKQLSNGRVKVLIIRMLNAQNMDGSAALAIREIVNFTRQGDQHILLSGIREEVAKVLEKVGVLKQLGAKNVFYYTPGKITVSTRGAVIRAHEILGASVPTEENEQQYKNWAYII